MKRNKLAAGALALALGLGAIAPSYAATDAQATAVKAQDYSGAQLFLEQYEAKLKEANDLRIKANAAQAKIDAAAKKLADAKADLEAKRAAYEALFPYARVVDNDGEPITPVELAQIEVQEAYEDLISLSETEIGNYQDHIKQIQDGKLTIDGVRKGLDKLDEGATVDNMDKLNAAKDRYINALKAYLDSNVAGSERLLAYEQFRAAQLAYDAAKREYDMVEKANIGAVNAYKAIFDELTKLAAGYNVTVQVGNDGIKVVDKDDDKVEVPEKELTEAQIKELRKAVADAKTTLRAVELLRELAPQKIADVKVELDALVKAQEARIARAEAILAKYNMSASLFSVAYASEEKKDDEATSEEVDNLINDINDSTDKINELIKDKEEKPEEEKPEEKPEEDKKDDSKKDDSKKEEKPAEKPAAPKKEAGKNAKTGIAGVAGVAGVLAAATAAYAASKRK